MDYLLKYLKYLLPNISITVIFFMALYFNLNVITLDFLSLDMQIFHLTLYFFKDSIASVSSSNSCTFSERPNFYVYYTTSGFIWMRNTCAFRIASASEFELHLRNSFRGLYPPNICHNSKVLPRVSARDFITS